MLLEHCVVAEAERNWYLLILIYFLYQKTNKMIYFTATLNLYKVLQANQGVS
jgi:hypothetical protein